MDKQFFNLTNPQKSIWYTENFYNNTPINNICGYVSFKEEVNLSLLQKAIQIYINQNDVFHLRLKMDGKTVVQYLTNYSFINVPVNYINSQEDFKNLGNRIASTPFKLFDSALVTAEIFLFPNSIGGFFFNVHHIISDALTLEITAKSISNIYYSLLNSEEIPVTETSYVDYINKEKEYMKSSRFEKDKIFWEETYSTVPDIATIPYAYSLSNNSSCLAKRRTFSLDLNEITLIKNFCIEHKTSLFGFFMSIYSIYINKISGLTDFTIGTPILNRNTFLEKNTPGMFVSTVPFRISIPENSTFSEFLEQSSKNSMLYLKHQKYPYTKLLEHIRSKSPNASNLYNILISYQITKPLNDKINYSTGWIFNGTVADDIQIHLTDFNETGKLDISYDYKINKYSDSSIENLHSRILYIIKQVIENPEINLNNIEIVLPIEKSKILSSTHVNYNYKNNIVLEIENVAQKYPDKIAIETNTSSISYKDLTNRINKLSNMLLTKFSIKQNSLIGILTSSTVDSIVGILAIAKINCTYVPIDPEYPIDRINHMINTSKIDTILFDGNSINLKSLFNYDINRPNNNNGKSIFNNIELINIEHSNYINSDSNFNFKFSYNKNSNLYVIFTSGSTGKPKGITISHKNMLNLIFFEKNNTDLFENSNKNKILQFATMSFDVSYQEIFSSLLTSSTLVLVDKVTRKNSDYLCNYINEKKVNILFIPPAYLRLLTKSEENLNKLNIVEKIITAGEALTITEGIKSLINNGAVLYNHYGPAETHVCTTYKIDKNNLIEIKPPIGLPIANTNVFILDSSNNLLPQNAIGQIAVSGDCVGNGYLYNESLTKEKFVMLSFENSNSPTCSSQNANHKKLLYLTGDLGYCDENGIIHLVRKKRFSNKIKWF